MKFNKEIINLHLSLLLWCYTSQRFVRTSVKSNIPDPQCNSLFLNLSSGIDVFQESNIAGELALEAIQA